MNEKEILTEIKESLQRIESTLERLENDSSTKRCTVSLDGKEMCSAQVSGKSRVNDSITESYDLLYSA